jgi:response regulator RpfG family c-di-GMP phosphodiesterase
MLSAVRVSVLCVDDEPNVLEGITLNLHRHYKVITAPGGAAGLEALEKDPSIAVVLSDLRMPGMDGTAFLSQARRAAPDTVRMLLTGHADTTSAIAAVNEGQVFRFLVKPCAPPALLAAFQAAVEQHRLVTCERVLLEQTLRGCIKMLTDVMSLANPSVFARATRIKALARELAEAAGLGRTWQVEVAAMLSQIGCIALPATTIEKVESGQALLPDEQAQVDRLPAMADSLLTHIPRLEDIRACLAHQARRYDEGVAAVGEGPRGDHIPEGARVLKIVTDFDGLEAQGLARPTAIDVMRGRAGWYDPRLLAAFAGLYGTGTRREIREIPLRLVTAGMTFAEDVRTPSGALLLPRGYEVTDVLRDRIRHFTVKGPVRVIVAGGREPQ